MAQQGKSLLASKLGQLAAKAHAEHKNDETTFGNMDLPPGIEGGVAQLVDCRFAEYEKGDMKGKLFFYAAGVVKEPVEYQGVKIEGLRTQIMEPICDTPNRSRKTVSEHMAWVYNELRKLGLDTSKLTDVSMIEPAVAALKKSAPHFRFRTWRGEPTEQFPNPRTNHQWAGAMEYSDNGDGASDVVDNTGGDTPSDEAVVDETTEQVEGTVNEGEGAEDLDALAELCGGEDEAADAAQDKMKALAAEVGISEDDVTQAESWAAVSDMIVAARAKGSGEEETAAEPEEATPPPAKKPPTKTATSPAPTPAPKKGEVWYYAPIDKKTGKPVKKGIEVDIVSVDAKAKTAEVRDLADKKRAWKGVPFAKLTEKP